VGTITVPWDYLGSKRSNNLHEISPLGFVEGGVNLGWLFDKFGTGIPGSDSFEPCFQSVIAVSRSSASVTSTLKDFKAFDFELCVPTVHLFCNRFLTTNGGMQAVFACLTVACMCVCIDNTFEFRTTFIGSKFGTLFDVTVTDTTTQVTYDIQSQVDLIDGSISFYYNVTSPLAAITTAAIFHYCVSPLEGGVCPLGQSVTKDTHSVHCTVPTQAPSPAPTNEPSSVPSTVPTQAPTPAPTNDPSSLPSIHPSHMPSIPTQSPKELPTNQPLPMPSSHPSTLPCVFFCFVFCF